MTDWPSRTAAALEKIRKFRPRVHCLTNAVAPELTANMLLAIGAQPSVTWNHTEIADFIASSQALLVNLGTLTEDRKKSIDIAVNEAARVGMPWVLDPVKVHRSPRRLDFAHNLLAQESSIIRCNADEAAALGETPAIKVITGEIDRIEQGDCVVEIANGDPLMDRVTAMGCAGSAVIATFAAVLDDPFEAAVCGLLTVNVAGDIAASRAEGPGSFKSQFLDALFNLDARALAARAKVTA